MRETFRDAEHLLRLVLLFAAGTLLFLLVRALLVPAGFGDLGFFRPGALDDNAARTPVYAGRAACAECHGEVSAALARDRHAGLSCEACHGPLAAHVADPDAVQPAAIEPVEKLCVRCHAVNQARPASQPQVEPAEHSEGNACTDCHDAHAPEL